MTQIWEEYQKGKNYLDSINLFTKVETCHDFVNGEQWKGLKYGKERPPMLNILEPMTKTATALVGQNLMSIQYTSMNYGANRQRLLSVCELLNNYAAQLWENMKMDKVMWDVLYDSYITGDSFVYFYDDVNSNKGKILCELLDTTNIMLGDEQQQDIQKQPYILIVQRKSIEEVRQLAESFGADEEVLSNITSDTDISMQINAEKEVKNNKVTLIAKFWKKEGSIHVMRATKAVVIQEDTEITGMSRYPLAKYTWKARKGTARGDGEIWSKIPNQISINKALFRFEQAVKSAAYPVKIYRQNAINSSQVSKLNQPGASIGLMGNADSPVTNVISYMQPGAISPYAVSYWQDLMKLTRELSGSGDNLENINPENASGAAIQATLEAKRLNVNKQVAEYKQFVEDIAWIWFDMAMVYNPDGLEIDSNERYEDGSYKTIIPIETLKGLNVNIKIDVVPTSQTYAAIKDAQLKDLVDTGKITFEEYVESLGKDSTMPVEELKKIVESRLAAAQSRMMGGVPDEMQVMRQ